MVAYGRMSNNGWNVLKFNEVPDTIESVEVTSGYTMDGVEKYFQSGTIVEIYEGVLPNVVV